MEYTTEELLDELEQCLNKIEFLYGCLEDPEINKHAYPEMTRDHIARLHKIVGPRRNYCLHSHTHSNCPSCQEAFSKRALRASMNEKIEEAKMTKRSECTCICHQGWGGFHPAHTCCTPMRVGLERQGYPCL